MAGKIRTREKCSQCGKPFKIIEEVDIYCPTCNTRPKTFYIFLYWHGKHRISRDQDGYILDSYRRVHRLLENIRKDIDNGIFNLSNYLPKEIEQFRGKNLLPKWIETRDIAPSYLREVKRYVKEYFTPYFENHDMRKIRTSNVEDFYLQLPGHLSKKTKKNIMNELKTFSLWLYRREVLARLPIFPKIETEEHLPQWIMQDMRMNIISHMDKHHRPIFNFLTFHPVRPGEARVLQVRDFDMKAGTVKIEKTFSLKEIRKRKGKKPYLLPISEHFDISILRDKLPNAFVFVNKAGRPYTSEGLRRLWHKAREKAKIPNISLYNATRHSIASQAINDGVPLHIISKALGHSTQDMTTRYAKMNVKMLKMVVDGSQMVQIGDFKKDKLLKEEG